ncbi:hypothetical protein [Streptomyces sp. NPDC001068]|uniref:hypothetical protein n=1 Tax=Streptomyces sp. NPDC001068 TaxID=3364544 RepID=UPI00369FD539
MATAWEYRTVRINGDAGWEEALNAAGREGWEAVGVVPVSASYSSNSQGGTQSMWNTGVAVLLKRPG